MKPAAQHVKRHQPRAQRARHLTALKRGLNSGAVLLPGDNVQAFRTLRHLEFRLFKPRNIEEARCAETIVAAHWRIERCRVEQRIFKQHLGAVLSGHPDVTGAFVDADPHRLHHRATDCGLEERRLEKSLREAKTELALLQKQRVQGFILGNEAELEDYTVFVAEGEPAAVEDGTAEAEAEPLKAESTCTPTRATRSANGEISKSLHSDADVAPNGFSVHRGGHREGASHRQSTGL